MKPWFAALLCLALFLAPFPRGARAESALGAITVMVFDRGNVPAGEGDAVDNRWTRWVKQNAPVDVSFVSVPRAGADQMLINMFASGSAPDYIPYGSNPQNFVGNGMALQITDDMLRRVPNYLLRMQNYPLVDQAATFGGVRYGFGRFDNVFHNHCVVIREDWLDALGLEMPETAEELLYVARAFTYDDPDGNGLNDTYGISMTVDSQRILAHMWGFPWPEKYVFDGDGALVYAWDRMEAWLGYVKTFVNDGCVNPDFAIMKGDDDRLDFLSGKLGIYAQARFSQYRTGLSLYRDFVEMNPGGKLAALALPETEFGKFTAYINGGVSFVGFINPHTQNLNGVLAYVNWLMEPEVEEYLSYGPPGVYYDKTEEGTYYAVASNEIIEAEIAWSPFFDGEVTKNAKDEANPHANDPYNQYLTAADAVSREYGALFYDLAVIANDKTALEPRKWQQFLPVLPSELQEIKVSANQKIDYLLRAAMCDGETDAADAVASAKKLWLAAGGERVDAYYAAYFACDENAVIDAEDFLEMKDAPVLTHAAYAAYRAVKGE